MFHDVLVAVNNGMDCCGVIKCLKFDIKLFIFVTHINLRESRQKFAQERFCQNDLRSVDKFKGL